MTIQIDPETGIVFRVMGYAKEKRCVYWAQCPNCGPQPPATETLAYRGGERVLVTLHPQTGERPIMGRCSSCGRGPVPLREAVIPASRNGASGACTRRCWQGKSVCRCACLGRCHGGGRCYCGEPIGGKA